MLNNDTDSDGDTLTAMLMSGPTQATEFSFDSDGSFAYPGLHGTRDSSPTKHSTAPSKAMKQPLRYSSQASKYRRSMSTAAVIAAVWTRPSAR